VADEPLSFLGEIRAIPYNFVPSRWALCDGSQMAISNNTALFSIIGTTYGGDGFFFNLPDLRDRTAMAAGAGRALAPRAVGESGGFDTITLDINTLAQHSHPALVTSVPGNTPTPVGTTLARYPDAYHTDARSNLGTMAPETLPTAQGGGGAHNNIQPSLTLMYVICLEGVYPN
jgi:microcystin-dependent protein